MLFPGLDGLSPLAKALLRTRANQGRDTRYNALANIKIQAPSFSTTHRCQERMAIRDCFRFLVVVHRRRMGTLLQAQPDIEGIETPSCGCDPGG
jgi:hypothetical protein